MILAFYSESGRYFSLVDVRLLLKFLQLSILLKIRISQIIKSCMAQDYQHCYFYQQASIFISHAEQFPFLTHIQAGVTQVQKWSRMRRIIFSRSV